MKPEGASIWTCFINMFSSRFLPAFKGKLHYFLIIICEHNITLHLTFKLYHTVCTVTFGRFNHSRIIKARSKTSNNASKSKKQEITTTNCTTGKRWAIT